MSPKNLNALKKTHKFLLNKLKDKRTFQIYKKFETELAINKNFIVAVSGGPDSLALSFLTKIYSIKKSLNIKYYIIDHRLRKNSKTEAEYVQKKLKNFSIRLNILTWRGLKPNKNIQAVAKCSCRTLLDFCCFRCPMTSYFDNRSEGDARMGYMIPGRDGMGA